MKSFVAALRNLVLPWGRTTGRRIVLDGDNGEILIYDATDTLVVTLTSQTPPGLIVGGPNDPQVQILSETNIGRILFDANSPAAGVKAAITEAIFNEGAANEHISLQFQGPGVTGATDRIEFLINSQNADGSSEANYLFRIAGGQNLYNADKTVGHTFFHHVGISPVAALGAITLLVDQDNAETEAFVQFQRGAKAYLNVTNDGRPLIFPDASANSAFYVDTDAGHTGNMFRFVNGTTETIAADSTGVLVQYGGNTFDTYVPTVNGGGAATFSTINGQYQRIGKLIWVRVYFVIGVAGSGAGNVTFTLPVTPHRALGRQNVQGSARDGGVAGAGPVVAIVFQGGAGATVDRIVNSAGTDVTGALLTAGSVWTFEGWIREN